MKPRHNTRIKMLAVQHSMAYIIAQCRTWPASCNMQERSQARPAPTPPDKV